MIYTSNPHFSYDLSLILKQMKFEHPRNTTLLQYNVQSLVLYPYHVHDNFKYPDSLQFNKLIFLPYKDGTGVLNVL